ncbi:DUF6378 domain-containing protein [Salinisphaera sp. T31B1]|uniref:DUF6378 domain-containing protein n=1 Tax=Salinisphaera sp. T31B1 TaxID=727963 RepID=UPI0033411BB5
MTDTTAHSILDAAGQHMRDRATTYDKPEGERSMAATVTAFNAITGHALTEEQGWAFMELLKITRSQSGDFRADNYEDAAAYAALRGEAAALERPGQVPPLRCEKCGEEVESSRLHICDLRLHGQHS